MVESAFHIYELPQLKTPLLIAGFDGWGNALDVSNSMLTYLIHELDTKYFAKINPDLFYRYDENRPLVNIEKGVFKSFSPPGGAFYFARTGSNQSDLVFLKATEPNLRWFHFVDEFIALCEKLDVETVITLGSMYDQVLHSDRVVSALASKREIYSKLKQKNVIAITYQGPGAIHSLIHSEAQNKDFNSISLWCHCPYYLQDVTHLGLMAHLGTLLSFLGNFELDVTGLEKGWDELNDQIQDLIDGNPKIQNVVAELRKAKARGSWASVKASLKKGEKVINLTDFFEPR